jgi:hypothetical protein
LPQLGVVTEGWLKGHGVKGEYTVITYEHDGYGVEILALLLISVNLARLCVNLIGGTQASGDATAIT